jgi:hypothetical protein
MNMKATQIAMLVSLAMFGASPVVDGQAAGPCALLTTAEVAQAFPGSKAGRLDRSKEKFGVVTCLWDNPSGLMSIVAGADEDLEPPKEEAQSWTMVFLDPLRTDAARHVRYEVLAGVGDEAVAIVEREDKTKGFMTNGAILVVRRGKRQVVVLSTDLARRERAEALRVFAELGKAIAKRLG